MPVFLVNLSPRASAHDYSALWKALHDADARQVMDAQWVVDVAQDLKTVTGALLSHCVGGDGVLVVELAPETRWTGTGLSAAEKAWFGEHGRGSQPPLNAVAPAPAVPPPSAPAEPRHYH